ncbi:MAG: sigma-70 family RNA polymerase sigma factor [Polyangiaceae bacterium]
MSSRIDELTMVESARFAVLLEQYAGGLRRVARAYAPRTDEAEDLFQEIALALFRALPSFRGECAERTFVFRVAHNRGLTFASRGRRPDRAGADREAEPDVPSDAPSPEERLDGERRRDALWSAIQRLTPGARACVTLALEGLSHDEIADVLGIQTNAVAVRLSRARDQLKALLGGTT